MARIFECDSPREITHGSNASYDKQEKHDVKAFLVKDFGEGGEMWGQSGGNVLGWAFLGQHCGGCYHCKSKNNVTEDCLYIYRH